MEKAECGIILLNLNFFQISIFYFQLFVVSLQRKKRKIVKEKLIYVSLCLLMALVVAACKSAHYCNCG